MLAVTIAGYLVEIDALLRFSFPLTAGLAAALFFSAILAPVCWYELRFGRNLLGGKEE